MAELLHSVSTALKPFDALLGAAIGAGAALAASWMGSRATRRRDRDRLSAELLTIYMKDVHGRYSNGLLGLRAPADTGQHYDAQLVGNWFEAFAALIVLGHASRRVCEASGLKCEMGKFWREAISAHREGASIDPRADWPRLMELLK